MSFQRRDLRPDSELWESWFGVNHDMPDDILALTWGWDALQVFLDLALGTSLVLTSKRVVLCGEMMHFFGLFRSAGAVLSAPRTAGMRCDFNTVATNSSMLFEQASL